MAISLVQHAEQDQASGTSIVKAFASNVTIGDLIIVAVFNQSQNLAAFSCSDSQGNSYSALTERNYNGSLASFQTFYALANATGANTVTISGLVSAVTWMGIAEFSGVKVSDVAAGITGSGNSQDSGAATTAQPVELLFGFIPVFGTFSSILTISPGSGWTTIASSISVQSSQFGFITEYQITSATGTFDATSTTTVGKGNSVNWGAQLVTFFDGVGQLAGTASGSSTVSGDLRGSGKLAGQSDGVASSSADLKGAGKLAGQSNGAATASAALVGVGALSGASAGVASSTAALVGLGALSGTVNGSSTAIAALQASGRLAGSSAGQSVATSTLQGSGRLQGTAAGSCTVTGTFTVDFIDFVIADCFAVASVALALSLKASVDIDPKIAAIGIEVIPQ